MQFYLSLMSQSVWDRLEKEKKQPWVNTNDKHALRHFKLDVKRGTEKPSHPSGSLICWTSEVDKTLEKKRWEEKELFTMQADDMGKHAHALWACMQVQSCMFSRVVFPLCCFCWKKKKRKKFKLHVWVGVIVHFYMPLSPFLICHFNCHYDRCAPYKPRITRSLLSLNGGISFPRAPHLSPICQREGEVGDGRRGCCYFVNYSF